MNPTTQVLERESPIGMQKEACQEVRAPFCQPIPGVADSFAPLIVAVGGTLRTGSSTERAMQVVLDAAAAAGARTLMIAGPALNMPLFVPGHGERTEEAWQLIDALRAADGIVLGSPGYHGSVSGLVKNALDYTEDMRSDPAPYFEGRAVGCIATGGGWQGAVATLSALRGIVHALRGWNTPLGSALNTAQPIFDSEGRCLDPKVHEQLSSIGRELVAFAHQRKHTTTRTSLKSTKSGQ